MQRFCQSSTREPVASERAFTASQVLKKEVGKAGDRKHFRQTVT